MLRYKTKGPIYGNGKGNRKRESFEGGKRKRKKVEKNKKTKKFLLVGGGLRSQAVEN